MNSPRLHLADLQISFLRDKEWKPVVDGVSFDIMPGEMLALLGESGCGKSITAMSLPGLLPTDICRITGGQAIFNGQDLYQLPEQELEKIRGNRISVIFQEPMTALNPVFTIGNQLAEILACHLKLSGNALYERCVELLEETGIPDPVGCLKKYPFELSGGMRQRAMIAMAVACEPDLIIADEPTTALDVTVQAQIMKLLRDLQKRANTSVLFITHNLALASQYADRCCVMYAGQIVESADNPELFVNPRHPYTRLLMRAIPNYAERTNALPAIAGMPPTEPSAIPGCRFAERCPYAQDDCATEKPAIAIAPAHFSRCTVSNATHTAALPGRISSQCGDIALSVRDLKVHFPVKSGIFRRTTGTFKAVDGISFDLHRGETLALVGESGCGKTTAGKAIIRLIEPTAGKVTLHPAETHIGGMRRRIQMIFQDPFSSLNPRLSIGESIAEGIRRHKTLLPGQTEDEALAALMNQVGLPQSALARYPHQFSGGQRQRIGLARALAIRPDIIICDECTSALDVSVQAQIINLLKEIQAETGISYIFITHDLGVVGYLADRICVMNHGQIVESGTTEEIYRNPQQEYTRTLLNAAPVLGKHQTP